MTDNAVRQGYYGPAVKTTLIGSIMRTSAMKAVLIAASASLIAASASAQAVSTTKGFYFGAAANWTSAELDNADIPDSERESGPGATLHLGYNFMPNIGVFLSGTAASIKPQDGGDRFTFGHGDAGLRFSLSATPVFVPYAEAAYTYLRVTGNDEGQDIELSGSGFTGAVGFNFFMTSKLALDVNGRYTNGEFDTVKFGGVTVSDGETVGVTTMRLNVGIAFYPGMGGSRSMRR